jgi:hypothetical protein
LLKKERRKIQVDFDLTKRIDSVLQIKKHWESGLGGFDSFGNEHFLHDDGWEYFTKSDRYGANFRKIIHRK